MDVKRLWRSAVRVATIDIASPFAGWGRWLRDAGRLAATGLEWAYRLALLALVVCIVLWFIPHGYEIEVFKEKGIYSGTCAAALHAELVKASSGVSELEHLGVCDPDPRDLARFFPQLDTYNVGTERVLWSHGFRPCGVLILTPATMRVVGEERAGRGLWYCKIPARYVEGRDKLYDLGPVD